MLEKFEEFDFTNCKIIGFKVLKNDFFLNGPNLANKVLFLLECDLRTKIILFENFMPYFIVTYYIVPVNKDT